MSLSYQPVIEARESIQQVRGVPYAVREWGESGNAPLFLLHGWGDNAATFQFLVDALSPQWHVIAPDWRGFGNSRLRAQSYWFPDYVADLDILLDRFSPAAPVKLFGHSMGGNIAGLYAGIMPERVSHFVNVEGFGLRDRDPADAPANYRRWLETGRTGSAYGTYASYDELAARIHKRSPRMPLAHARYVAAAWASEGADGRIHIKADPAHKLPNPVLYRRSEAEACWQQVTAEVLLVSGVDSEFNSETLSWVETDAADLPFPGAQHQQIADAGHMIHFEQPAALAAMVERFLPGP